MRPVLSTLTKRNSRFLRSARLAGLSPSQPVIPVSDDEFPVDDISLGDDEMPDPERPYKQCGGNPAVYGLFSCEFLQCRYLPVQLQCATKLVSDQSVVCPCCRRSRSLPFCCVCDVNDHGIVFQPPMLSPADAFRVFGTVCDHCPFCTRDLVSFLTDSIVVASLSHLHLLVDLNAIPLNAAIDPLNVSSSFPPAPPMWPLYCFRSTGPPDFFSL